MTIEEKAKAYDEALKKMQPLYEQAKKDDNPIWSTYEYLFPQICESEDERIRKDIVAAVEMFGDFTQGRKKEIYAYLENQNHDGKKWITPAEFNRLETLRYEAGFDDGVRSEMKKQKEQKSIESIAAEVTKDKESAIKFLKSAGIMDDNGELAEMYRSEPKPAENDTRTKIISRATSEKQVVLISESNGSAEIGWDTRSLEDTKKLLEYGLAFINKQLGVKPAEWSEEDEERIQSILFSIGYCKEEYLNKKDYSKDINWLKSLRPQHRDYAITFWTYLDEHRPEGKMCLSNGECADIEKAFIEHDWGKIIRYANKYAWKPREEQLKALESCFCEFGEGCPDEDGLHSLYNDLKKLM